MCNPSAHKEWLSFPGSRNRFRSHDTYLCSTLLKEDMAPFKRSLALVYYQPVYAIVLSFSLSFSQVKRPLSIFDHSVASPSIDAPRILQVHGPVED
ncbi:uncharacterized protein K452DRAFT_144857 [Aplosporella prunicola CBS 121167]|uniref:Uncharacterized protein n=1 Tax=Aplosporella prunicola CBS 121167 TaxID=1176127 RepID=A0A6A6BN00_9PEZI|nr:uncharacterized protein K452DRAFT_144857 [Aplosporella prunicola CBS 121167]KAF2144635.1 hypothetical protein K452DRAFT_144857 [Aplosporella prunicola CBS 121167]